MIACHARSILRARKPSAVTKRINICILLSALKERGDDEMGYSHTNSKGQKYYLHKKGRLFFFSKMSAGSISLPSGFKVIENRRTGLPMVKRV